MRALLLAVALLLAGCAGPAAPADEQPLERASLREGTSRDVIHLPLAPAPPPRESPRYDECGRYTVRATPTEARAGEPIRVTVRFENCGNETIWRATPCLSKGWDPRIVVDERTRFLADGPAEDGLVCLTAIGSWSVEPGEAIESSWTWNGTLHRYAQRGDGTWEHIYEDAPPGDYAVRSALDQLSGPEPVWGGETRVRLHPR